MGMPIRQTVRVLAMADLVLAVLVLFFEAAMLAGCAIALIRLRAGNLSSDELFENLFAFAGFLGMFLLYLPALIALPLGGVGLLKRTRWGYFAHMAGAALVAVSCFAIVYTIPAMVIALLPQFRRYFFSPPSEKPVLFPDLPATP